MSETILDSAKSKSHESSSTKSPEVTRTIKRLNEIMSLWSEHADNEFEFGVLRGLQTALDVLENR